MAVNDGGNGGLKHDLGLGVHMDGVVFDGLVIAHQALGAVAAGAVEVSQQQNVRDLTGFFGVEAKLDEGVVAEALQLGIGVFDSTHEKILSFIVIYVIV